MTKACISVLYAMKALRDSGFKLECRIRLIVGLDEESGGRCIARYLETEEIPGSSFSPDANFPLINAEKEYFTAGWKKSSQIREKALPTHSSIKGGERYNVVPDSAEAVFDGLFEENIIRKMRSAEASLSEAQMEKPS